MSNRSGQSHSASVAAAPRMHEDGGMNPSQPSKPPMKPHQTPGVQPASPVNPDPKAHPIHPPIPTQPIHENQPIIKEGSDPKRPVVPDEGSSGEWHPGPV
jgi:hypothetical protein